MFSGEILWVVGEDMNRVFSPFGILMYLKRPGTCIPFLGPNFVIFFFHDFFYHYTTYLTKTSLMVIYSVDWLVVFPSFIQRFLFQSKELGLLQIKF